MQKKKFFLIDCSKAENCCDKSQYNEAGFMEKVNMLFHLMLCRACRKYTSKNTKLTHLIKKAEIKPCSEAEKKNHKQKLEEAITRQNT